MQTRGKNHVVERNELVTRLNCSAFSFQKCIRNRRVLKTEPNYFIAFSVSCTLESAIYLNRVLCRHFCESTLRKTSQFFIGDIMGPVSLITLEHRRTSQYTSFVISFMCIRVVVRFHVCLACIAGLSRRFKLQQGNKIQIFSVNVLVRVRASRRFYRHCENK